MQVPHPLIFVRHGQTDWNLENRFQGTVDTPLNESGLQQAGENARIVSRLVSSSGVPKEAWQVISSPLLRARQTATALVSEHGFDLTTDKRLREVSWGRWEGLSSQEVKDRFYEERKRRKLYPWQFSPQGGESLKGRCPEVQLVLETTRPATIYVSHSGVIRIIKSLIGGFDPEIVAKQDIPHIGVWLWDDKILTLQT